MYYDKIIMHVIKPDFIRDILELFHYQAHKSLTGAITSMDAEEVRHQSLPYLLASMKR